MTFYRQFAYGFLILIFFLACNSKQPPSGGNSRYDLLNPVVIKLPGELAEISGIVYYPKDTSVFAIEDEDGVFYKIYLNGNNQIKKWKFDKKHDYEDVVLHDSIFYVLISNGDIESLHFNGDSIVSNTFFFPDASKKTNEFESLYFDDSLRQLILLCKDCEDDNKKTVSAWGFSIDSQLYTPSVLTVDVQPLAEKLGELKMKLKPSATAINPVTNELYILSSISHLLVVTDRNGKFKEVFKLDPAIYKQAEGIAFTATGDMIISNESHETGVANILIIKNKKKGL
ncbi:MAG: SdiA-regulated domain-containing protein [Ferruginibacter sp.]